MAARRTSSIRGTRTPRPTKAPAPRPEEFAAEDVTDPTVPRDLVSYALARRAVLESLRRSGWLTDDPCDADPTLLRAARHHGEPAGRDCPLCRRTELVEVIWVFGAQLGALSGSARSSQQVVAMATEYGRFRVHVVEVCRRCGWNHLVTSYSLGDGLPRPLTRRATPHREAGEA